MSMLTPADENELRQALTAAHEQNHPVAVRYPRGAGAGVTVQPELSAMPCRARARFRRHGQQQGGAHVGSRVAILAFGTLLYPALAAAESLDATVANMRFVKPLDTALVLELARTHDLLVTVEGVACQVVELGGGRGSGRSGRECAVDDAGAARRVRRAWRPAKLLSMCGLDAAGIERSVRDRLDQAAGTPNQSA